MNKKLYRKRFTLNFKVVKQYVACDISITFSLYSMDEDAYDDENSQFLVDDIVDELKKRDIDWAKYDWNDDGYINQLLPLWHYLS